MQVRYSQAADVEQIVQLLYDTVHLVNCHDYTNEQLNAWMAAVPDPVQWAKRYETRIVFVAEDDRALIAGFAELEASGHIDCFYCHHAYQRQGVGRSLLLRLETEARLLGFDRLFVAASITARPFFERMGYVTLGENQVVRNQVVLINFLMEKYL